MKTGTKILLVILAIAVVVGIILGVRYMAKKKLVDEIMAIAATRPNSDADRATVEKKSLKELKELLAALKAGAH